LISLGNQANPSLPNHTVFYSFGVRFGVRYPKFSVQTFCPQNIFIWQPRTPLGFAAKNTQMETLGCHAKAPWWISAAIGVLAFIGLRWGLPAWAGDVSARQMIANGIVPLAPLPLLFFGIFAAGSFWFSRHRRRLVDAQTSLQSLRNTPWKQFEFLVAEAYRRQGYQVEYSLGRGADGGVDLTLRRDGRMSLVQCKQWKVFFRRRSGHP
jgi:hypothetical protein